MTNQELLKKLDDIRDDLCHDEAAHDAAILQSFTDVRISLLDKLIEDLKS